MKVAIIPADPDEPIREEDAPSGDTEFTAWARDIVGGWLELHMPRSFPRSGVRMWIGEEAKMQQRLPNLRATQLAMLAPLDYIAGEVVLTGSNGPDLADLPLDFSTLVQLVDMFMMTPPAQRIESVQRSAFNTERTCSKCQRKSVAHKTGDVCGMSQPDSSKCDGVFE